MYEDFFSLETKPFELVPNPYFLFLSASHRKAINYLSYGLQEQAGFILLAGEVGSGKTTLIRNLIKDLEGIQYACGCLAGSGHDQRGFRSECRRQG
jgi:type II secretory pathway predicted ATPase ExeA